jgi:uncharacterized MAPEG superfamily protein
MMKPSAASAYLMLLLGLFLKYALMIAIQGVQRKRRHVFRWPEDAACWRGQVQTEDAWVERAQAVLRNDSESQPLFLAASAAWIALGADAELALGVCGAYVATRWLHAYWLLRPRQPQRTRVFGVSLLCVLLVLFDVGRLLWG